MNQIDPNFKPIQPIVIKKKSVEELQAIEDAKIKAQRETQRIEKEYAAAKAKALKQIINKESPAVAIEIESEAIVERSGIMATNGEKTVSEAQIAVDEHSESEIVDNTSSIAKSAAPSPSDGTISQRQTKAVRKTPKHPKAASGNRNRFTLSFSDKDYKQIQELSDRLHLPAATMLRSWVLERISFK